MGLDPVQSGFSPGHFTVVVHNTAEQEYDVVDFASVRTILLRCGSGLTACCHIHVACLTCDHSIASESRLHMEILKNWQIYDSFQNITTQTLHSLAQKWQMNSPRLRSQQTMRCLICEIRSTRVHIIASESPLHMEITEIQQIYDSFRVFQHKHCIPMANEIIKTQFPIDRMLSDLLGIHLNNTIK